MKSNPEGQGGSKAMKSPRLLVPFQLVSGKHRLGIGREKDMEDGASSPLSPCRSRLAVTFGGTALPGLSLLFSSKSPPKLPGVIPRLRRGQGASILTASLRQEHPESARLYRLPGASPYKRDHKTSGERAFNQPPIQAL